MERNLERQTLSFSKGMTNVPSDLLSDDSELLESDGFIFKDGEMKAVQKPVKIGEIAGQKIMYVHKMADYENIITYDGTEKIYWYTKDDSGNIVSPPDGVTKSFNVGTVYDVKSIGNTLAVATNEGLHYLLFKGGKYKDLGTEIPTPNVVFSISPSTPIEADTPIRYEGFVNHKTLKVSYDDFGNVCRIHKLIYIKNSGDFGEQTVTINDNTPVKEEDYEAYAITNDNDNNENLFQDAVVGHVSSIINKAKEKNLFCFPFYARYALRLFDGTYARISNPVICYPCVTGNHHSHIGNTTAYFTLYGSSLTAAVSIPQKEDWVDIVKEIVFFATKGVMPYKLEKGWKFGYLDEVYGMTWHDDVGPDNYTEHKYSRYGYTDEPSMRIIPSLKTKDKIAEELKKDTVFYKISQLSVMSENVDGVSSALKIDDGVLSTLETQEQLKKDDYYGWAHYVFKKMYPYNGRLNAIGVYRSPFEGFSSFCALKGEDVDSYKYYVHIESGSMSRWVESKEGKAPKCTLNGWFFYPDPNATEVIVYDVKNNRGIKSKLQPHPLLNGSYKMALPDNTIEWEDNISLPSIDNEIEDLNSQIFTSVVNNPFVFEASGDNTVGTGKILGIIANTEAVSQGQFGQYPLMVFTDEGIYGLSVNSEGLYSRAYPISREVCSEDSPLVPTDRLVFFASKKGLMASSGGSVACMSEQMRGRSPRNFATFGEGKFLDFLKGCLIAYDYRDSILRIFSKGKSYQYIYNMVDKTFSMVNSGIEAQAVVNDYPDNLIQDTNGNVYSLTAKPDINEDTESYSGSFTTRPLKLGGSMTLKSLRAVKHLFDSDEGTIGLEIYGSNDCKHWCKLPSVGGKPWKYFTFKYTLQNFKAADAFAGSIVEVQSRREDKMR